MAESITNIQQKRDQIDLEYDQDVLECENINFRNYLKISSGHKTGSYGTDESKKNMKNGLYTKCMTIAQKSKELKLAKLN